MNRLTRYWKYAGFETLVPGVALAIGAVSELVWKDDPDPFWKMRGGLVLVLCSFPSHGPWRLSVISIFNLAGSEIERYKLMRLPKLRLPLSKVESTTGESLPDRLLDPS